MLHTWQQWVTQLILFQSSAITQFSLFYAMHPCGWVRSLWNWAPKASLFSHFILRLALWKAKYSFLFTITCKGGGGLYNFYRQDTDYRRKLCAGLVCIYMYICWLVDFPSSTSYFTRLGSFWTHLLAQKISYFTVMSSELLCYCGFSALDMGLRYPAATGFWRGCSVWWRAAG